MDNDIDVGGRLDELMQAHPHYRGRGQSALARDTGVPQPTINRILANKSVPEMATTIKLAQKFGVMCEWLLTGRGPKFVAELGAWTPSGNVLHSGIPEEEVRENLPEEVEDALQSVFTAFRTGADIRSAAIRTIIWYALTPVESGNIATRIQPSPAEQETAAMHDFAQQAKERAAEGLSGTRADHVEPSKSGKKKRH